MENFDDINQVRLKRLRLLIGQVGSQSTLAAKFGVTPGYVNQWLMGRRPFTEKTARKQEKNLGLDQGWFDQPIADQIDRIDSQLEEIGKTWSDLARALDISDQEVSEWRKPSCRTVPQELLLQVAEFIYRTKDWILTGQSTAGYMPMLSSGTITKRSRAPQVAAPQADIPADVREINEISLELHADNRDVMLKVARALHASQRPTDRKGVTPEIHRTIADGKSHTVPGKRKKEKPNEVPLGGAAETNPPGSGSND